MHKDGAYALPVKREPPEKITLLTGDVLKPLVSVPFSLHISPPHVPLGPHRQPTARPRAAPQTRAATLQDAVHPTLIKTKKKKKSYNYFLFVSIWSITLSQLKTKRRFISPFPGYKRHKQTSCFFVLFLAKRKSLGCLWAVIDGNIKAPLLGLFKPTFSASPRSCCLR